MVILAFGFISKSTKSKGNVKKSPNNLPAWYNFLRIVAIMVLLFCVGSYFIWNNSLLLWVGISGLVILDVIHSVLKALSASQKKPENQAGQTVQPSMNSNSPTRNQDTASYLGIDLPNSVQLPESPKYESIDYFGDSGKESRKQTILMIVSFLIIILAVFLILSAA